MRPPLSAIEPFTSGVSTAMRGLAASTASRVNTWPPGTVWARGLRRARRRRRAGRARCAGAGVPEPGRARRAARLLLRLLLLLLGLALLFHLRHADEILPGEQHDRREHDREEGILLVGHSCFSRTYRPCARLADGRVSGRRRIRRSCGRTAARARPAGRSARSHARLSRASAAERRTTSRRRRRTRLRSTALPTFFDTVNPKRDGALSLRARAPAARTRRRGPSRRRLRRGNPPVASAAPCKRCPVGACLYRRTGAHFAGTCGRRQALSRLRPLARRVASTLRPPTVAVRARKPCRRLRTSLLG